MSSGLEKSLALIGITFLRSKLLESNENTFLAVLFAFHGKILIDNILLIFVWCCIVTKAHKHSKCNLLCYMKQLN